MNHTLTLLRTLSLLRAVLATDMLSQQTSFADDLTSSLYAADNECTSSLGVSMAFGLIYPAATGASQTDMKDVFGYPEDKEQLVWQDASEQLTSMYDGKCLQTAYQSTECELNAPVIKIANTVWVNDEVTLDEDYAAVVGDLARSIDFSDEGAGALINDWVEDSTNGLIDSIVQDGSLPSNWILLAVNSLYLKAAWQTPFYESQTNKDTFYSSPARLQAVDDMAHFMHQVEYFPYSHTALPGYQVLQMPFMGREESRGLSIIFVLPGVQGLTNTVSQQDVMDSMPQLENQRVAVALPKFKFSSMYTDALMDSLKSTGLEAPFEGDLCVRQGSCGAKVAFVVQKTVIDVNEKGVEAAAVTALAVDESFPSDVPMQFMCDHPFQFFIHDESTGVILFEGRVGNPGIPDGATEAQLQSSHTEDEFWMSNFFVEPVVASHNVTVTDDNKPGNTADTNPEDASSAGRVVSMFTAVLVLVAVLVL